MFPYPEHELFAGQISNNEIGFKVPGAFQPYSSFFVRCVRSKQLQVQTNWTSRAVTVDFNGSSLKRPLPAAIQVRRPSLETVAQDPSSWTLEKPFLQNAVRFYHFEHVITILAECPLQCLCVCVCLSFILVCLIKHLYKYILRD